MFKINPKGQIFSLDFLMSMILVILIIGMIIQTSELNNYNTKEYIEKKNMEDSLNSSLMILLANTQYNCELNGTTLKNTIDKRKLLQKTNIKEEIGLLNYDLELIVNNKNYTPQLIDKKNIFAIETEIMTCEKSTDYINMDLTNCLNNDCFKNFLTKEKIILKVGK